MPGQVLYPVPPYNNVYPKPVGDLGGGLSALGQGGGGGLLAALFPPQINQASMTPVTNDQGQTTDFNITPASIGGGFMNRLIAGRQGLMQVNALNTEMQLERMRQLGILANTRETGIQTRQNVINQQVSGILAGHKLADTPENRAFVAKYLDPLQQEIEKGIESGQLQTTQSDQGKKAIASSQLATLMGPSIAASKASEIETPPEGTTSFIDPNNPQGGYNTQFGALPFTQQLTPVLNPDYMKGLGGPMYTTLPTGYSSATRGGLQVSPFEVQRAQTAFPSQQGGQGFNLMNGLVPPSTQDSGQSQFNLMNQPSTQQPSIIPSKPAFNNQQDISPGPVGINPNAAWIGGQTLRNAITDAPQNLGLSPLWAMYQKYIGQPFAQGAQDIWQGITQ